MEPHVIAVALVVVIMGFFILDSILGTNSFGGSSFMMKAEETKEIDGITLFLAQVGIPGPMPGRAVGSVSYQGVILTATKGNETTNIVLKPTEMKTFTLGGKTYFLTLQTVDIFTNEARLRLSLK